ncbi:MAG: hypothetical protein K8M05_14125, partial [Deltaproteobacteria bacterium]|nr:hypothetical protein [Kofleriaceae bacterium]
VGLLVTAPVLGTRAIVLALLAPVAAIALAALLLPIPWLLRRRPRVVAGAIAGAASGPPFSLALFDRMTHGGVPSALYLALLSVLVAGAGMLLTRAVKWNTALGPAVIFSPLLALPTPAHLLLWMGLGFAGALLVDPDAARD